MGRMTFSYHGSLPASKSMLNRLLLIQYYFSNMNSVMSSLPPPKTFGGKLQQGSPELHEIPAFAGMTAQFQIEGDSQCDDVLLMREGLESLKANTPIDCGAAAFVFRHLVLAASRIPGKHLLRGTSRLLGRPHEPVQSILRHLGVSVQITEDSWMVISEGWKQPTLPLRIETNVSSQFLSAVILNAWQLPFDMHLLPSGDAVSEGYTAMTIELAKRAGMKFQFDSNKMILAAQQTPLAGTYSVESDVSSAFAVCSLATVAGEAIIQNYPHESLQPDRIFPELLKVLGANVAIDGDKLCVRQKTKMLSPLRWNFRNTPDLFPIAAILCGLARGTSSLVGAPHLAHKESDRILKTAQLLQKMGCPTRRRDSGLDIMGQGMAFGAKAVEFDPDDDHRLVMAAAIANAAGHKIKVHNKECVRKSFPEFLEIAKEYL